MGRAPALFMLPLVLLWCLWRFPEMTLLVIKISLIVPRRKEADGLSFGRAVLMLVIRTTMWGLLGLARCQDSNLPTTALQPRQPAGRRCRCLADTPQTGRAPLPGWKLSLVNSSLLVLYFSQQLSQEPWHLFISPPLWELTCRMGKRFAWGWGQGERAPLCLLKANSSASEALQGIAGLMNLQEFWGELLLPWGWLKCPR